MRRARSWLKLQYFLVLLFVVLRCQSAPLSVVNSISNLWGDVAFKAAEAAIEAIQKQTKHEVTLRDVPLETLQVFVGQRHQLGLEIDGITYEVTLNTETTPPPASHPPPPQDTTRTQLQRRDLQALPASSTSSSSSSNALIEYDPQRFAASKVPLPEVTLAGPLELVLNAAHDVSLFLPHSTDVGAVRRIVLAPGACVKLSGLSSIALRKPLELAPLPPAYLAEVYAHIKLGEPEAGYEQSPGMQYLANQLRQLAEARAAAAQQQRGAGPSLRQQLQQLPLLSLEVEPAAAGLVLAAASTSAGGSTGSTEPPRLKAWRLEDGALEIALRQRSLAAGHGSRFSAVGHIWAWPLPQVAMGSWVAYESLLRGVLASHPFDLGRVAAKGIALRLTRSSISGVSLMRFSMEVRAKALPPGSLSLLDLGAAEPEAGPLEVWDVMVQLRGGGEGGVEYLPVDAKRREVYHSTLALAPGSMRQLLMGNRSVPLGYESQDVGLAAYAP